MLTNPLPQMDGLLKKTKYGPEYVVGKDGFMMSWVSRWTDWLNFDNYRGPNGGSKLPRQRWHLGCILLKMPAISLLTGLLNRDCIDAVLGVSMMGTPASWTTNPLGMVSHQGSRASALCSGYLLDTRRNSKRLQLIRRLT